MLPPDSRTLLIDQLAPPPGYAFDAAVATTFTLDLTATLLPALAFTGFHLAGGTSDPIATLEAIRSTADHIDVFCQAGAIGVPEKSPDLLAFLEPMVHPVKPPGAGLFHPKTWFIRYVDKAGSACFRLLVLTRNLTMDSSWDLAVRLDSERLDDHVQAESVALQEFIRSLPARAVGKLADSRRQRIERLADEAGRVEWKRPNNVDGLTLHYLNPGRDLTLDLRGSRHLVVSPFIDGSGLERVRPKGAMQVVSRAEELDKLTAADIERIDARVLDELAVVQEVQESRLGGQLHAKMYVVEQSTAWSQSHVFIGSANATGTGFTVNTEFMVELRGHRKHLGIDKFLGGKGTFMDLTEPYARSGEAGEDDAARRELENALRRLAGVAYTVNVLDPASGQDAYTLRLTSNREVPLDEGWLATVELLTLGDHAAPVRGGEALDALVPGVRTADITPFLAFRLESPTGARASTVIVADLVNAPDDRLDVVLARQIDSPEKFLRFLFFLLSLGNPAALARLAITQTADGTGSSSPFGTDASGVLEMVLGAIASRPEAIADLDALVTRLETTDAGRSSLPSGFLEFWAVVREAVMLGEEVTA